MKDDYFLCPRCQTKCDEHTIVSCMHLRCPNCNYVFEPDEAEDVEDE